MLASKYYTSQLDNYWSQPSILEERDACGVGFLVDLYTCFTMPNLYGTSWCL